MPSMSWGSRSHTITSCNVRPVVLHEETRDLRLPCNWVPLANKLPVYMSIINLNGQVDWQDFIRMASICCTLHKNHNSTQKLDSSATITQTEGFRFSTDSLETDDGTFIQQTTTAILKFRQTDDLSLTISSEIIHLKSLISTASFNRQQK